MTNLLIVAGVLVLSFALRTSHLRVIRKAGALGVLGATFLAFYFFTDSVAVGVVGGLLWFLLPWVELLTRIRRLRLPPLRRRRLRARVAGAALARPGAAVPVRARGGRGGGRYVSPHTERYSIDK